MGKIYLNAYLLFYNKFSTHQSSKKAIANLSIICINQYLDIYLQTKGDLNVDCYSATRGKCVNKLYFIKLPTLCVRQCCIESSTVLFAKLSSRTTCMNIPSMFNKHLKNTILINYIEVYCLELYR